MSQGQHVENVLSGDVINQSTTMKRALNFASQVQKLFFSLQDAITTHGPVISPCSTTMRSWAQKFLRQRWRSVGAAIRGQKQEPRVGVFDVVGELLPKELGGCQVAAAKENPKMLKGG